MEPKPDIQAVLGELTRLDAQIESAADLNALKPIFYRLEEVTRAYPDDVDVRVKAAAIKEHLMSRGMQIRETESADAGPALEHTATLPAMPSKTSPREVYVPPVRPVTPPPPPPRPQPQTAPANMKKAILSGAGIGVLAVLFFLAAIAYLKRKPLPPPVTANVPVSVSTLPAGASVRVNDQARCQAPCRVELAPGRYNLSSVLAGYDTALQAVTIEKDHPLSLSLTLTPQLPSLKILTDLGNDGHVFLDAKPAGNLQDGQLALDRLPAGPHELRVVSDKGGEAKFNFTVMPGAAPAIQGPVAAKNLAAVVASSLATAIHVSANTVPMKISIDGKPVGDAGSDGLDLQDITPGDHELTLNDGKEDRKLTVAATPSPVLMAWINASANGGILIVNAGEDGVTVLIDGKAYPRKTKRGQLWIPNLPPKAYSIKVAKDGFEAVPEQKAALKKGAETRLAFNLRAIPKIAVLKIAGGIAGSDVAVDKQVIGKIESDGTLSYANITPGEHTIEIRHESYTPKTISRTFGPGATVELSGDAVAMERPTGGLKLTVTPANAQVTIRRADETRATPIVAGTHSLPLGSYTLTAKAPGYADATMNVVVKTGEPASADLKLNKEAAPPPKAAAKADWEHPGEWQPDQGWLIHRGGNFVPFNAQPSTGIFTFSCELVKGGVFNKHIQWRAGYMDDKNYIHFQIDKKSLQSRIVTNGRSVERPKIQLDVEEPFIVQIEITPEAIVHRLREGTQWVVVDRMLKPGANQGKFGFFIPGKDEIAISSFSFAPR